MPKKNLTRHNGRSGKNGAYNPKHNDRRFDVENSEHIDTERVRRNVYWDCYQGFHFPKDQEQEDKIVFSFEQIEKAKPNYLTLEETENLGKDFLAMVGGSQEGYYKNRGTEEP